MQMIRASIPCSELAVTHSPLLFLVKSVSRRAAPAFSSPGIFGVPPC